jgi:hypothetical protein
MIIRFGFYALNANDSVIFPFLSIQNWMKLGCEHQESTINTEQGLTVFLLESSQSSGIIFVPSQDGVHPGL